MRPPEAASGHAGRTLVTGGAGFIGSHVVRMLVETGAKVRVLDLEDARVDHLPLPCIEVVRGDIRDVSAVRRAIEGCDRVIHLAANPNLWARRAAEFDEINHQGTRHVLEAAKDAGAKRVVHVSTESILTAPGSNRAITEQTPLRLSDAVGPYCLSKMRAELAAMDFARRGLPVVIASPTIPVGPGDHRRGPLTRMISQFAEGRIRAYMDAEINLIDVRDVAAGIIAALERGSPGHRYLLAAENWRLGDLFAALAGMLGRTPPRWRVPPAVALGFAWLEEQYCRFAPRRTPMATVTGVRLAMRHQSFDGSASISQLGLTLRPCLDALREEIEWLRGSPRPV